MQPVETRQGNHGEYMQLAPARFLSLGAAVSFILYFVHDILR